MKREIKCRLLIPNGNGYQEFKNIRDEEQCKYSDEYARRMREVLNAKPVHELYGAASAVPQ